MLCPTCNKKIPDQSKFCLECGSDISSASQQSGVEGDVSIGNMKTQIKKPSTESDLSMGDMRTVGRVENAGSSNKMGLVSEALAERYELGEEIGRGGFATVFRATDKKLGRTVAIKKLHPEQADPVTMARFRREAISIAGLNHRNIVQVYDVGEDPSDGSLYLVMELIEGGSLYDLLKKSGKLKLPEAMELFKGIAQGLSHAHRKNLVHRDIKPANILLQHEGETIVPKIVDFGLAQAGRESELSMSGYGMGTVVYMPPEQRRDAKSVNHTADVYALGKVLYEMVAGESPDNVDPEMIPPPPELAKIIFKCVKSKPEDRFFSVDEVLQALDGLGGITTSRKEVQKAAAGNPCPACGVENEKEAKFCVKCGVGLNHICGECGREESAHNQFCGACGTDVEGFVVTQEILQRIEKYAAEQKWSRVTKEYDLFNQEVRLPGKKGSELRVQLDVLNKTAQKQLKQREKIKQQVDSDAQTVETHWKQVCELEQKKQYQEAYPLLKVCLKICPKNEEFLKMRKELLLFIEQLAGESDIVDLGEEIKLELVWVPPTTSKQWVALSGGKDCFLMGSPKEEEDRFRNEVQHPVRLTTGFWMAKHSVTQAQYEYIMGTNPSYFKRTEKVGFLKKTKHTLPDHPVESVSWNDAMAFCKKLTEREQKAGRLTQGWVYTLPTEAQWEYACRAGTAGKYAGDLDEMAWYGYEKSGKKTHPVGTKKPNAWGLYDMHGNVWEWCLDRYGDYPSGSVTDPSGASFSSYRVLRGGGWLTGASYCRSANRYFYSPECPYGGLGFRPVLVQK